MNQKSEYEKELSKNSEYIKAPVSGMVSYRVDGLESVLTPDCFSALTSDYLNGLDLKTGKIIATSDEEGKIVDNFYCYIATVMNSDKAKEAEVGDKLKLRLLNDEEISTQIEYINKSDENNIIVVFKINKMVAELINYRKIDFDVIWWSSSGLKVPNQSILTDDNGLTYVIRNRSGYLTKMLVKVLKSNETHSIIDTYDTDELTEIGYEDITNYKKISLYDEIILNPTWDMVEN
jgi:putative membrane fusion protein